MDLKKREEKIIELLRESEKSFTELNEQGGDLLKSESTLSRHLNNLKNLDYIKDFKVDHENYRSKYRLTEKFYEEYKEQNEKTKIGEIMVSRYEWQTINKILTRYLETEYPYLNQLSLPVTYRELFGDLYSYLKYFDFSRERIEENYTLFFDLALYLVYSHPDKKYDFISNYHNFKIYKFTDLIDQLKDSDKIVEFVLKSKRKLQEEKYYLLYDDPILYLIRQRIETYFPKFIICWEFPEADLKKNFDFLLQFSNFIYDEVRSSSTNKTELQEFFYKFKICFMIYIREYIFRFLERIRIAENDQNYTLPPLQLLPNEQKMTYWSEYLLSPQMISTEEKKTFEKFIFPSEINTDQKIEYLENLISKLFNNIKDLFNPVHKKLMLESVILESHLLFLIRIYQKYHSESYEELKKKINKEEKDFRLSYSAISDDIFKKINENKIGLTEDANFDEIAFLIRQTTERLDHLTNIIEKGEKINKEVKHEITDILDIIAPNLDKKYIHPIYKKIINIYLKGYEIFDFEKISEIIQFLLNKYPKDIEIGILLFKLIPYFKNINTFQELLNMNQWDLKEKVRIMENVMEEIPGDFDITSLLNIDSNVIPKNYKIKEEGRRKFGNSTISKIEDNRLEKIQGIFSKKFENDDYVFKVVFPKKYEVPSEWDIEEWESMKKKLKEDTAQLIEVLDINLYYSTTHQFEYLYEMLIIIYRNFGLEWALLYLDNYIEYLGWYYLRMDQIDVLKIFQIKTFENFGLILDFISNSLKSFLFWEYRDRERAKNFLSIANKNLEKMHIKMEHYQGLDVLKSYFHQYQNLFTKIMI
ncbi:MAG: ArsR family transcriptional regulator [Candidatus Lokiarchaeota archaeon]|nr:ArsR family transcriptional regulator [Candidatus Lokiarchaeota archaeon]